MSGYKHSVVAARPRIGGRLHQPHTLWRSRRASPRITASHGCAPAKSATLLAIRATGTPSACAAPMAVARWRDPGVGGGGTFRTTPTGSFTCLWPHASTSENSIPDGACSHITAASRPSSRSLASTRPGRLELPVLSRTSSMPGPELVVASKTTASTTLRRVDVKVGSMSEERCWSAGEERGRVRCCWTMDEERGRARCC